MSHASGSKGRKDRAAAKGVSEVHAYVFGRERDLCRICRWRGAESMHELRFRSLGGKVSRRNSVAACGSGTTGCHGFAQRNEIAYEAGEYGAEGTVRFQARTQPAAEWLKVQVGQWIESPVMREMEMAE